MKIQLKLIPIIVTVLLLSSAILLVIPSQDAFANHDGNPPLLPPFEPPTLPIQDPPIFEIKTDKSEYFLDEDIILYGNLKPDFTANKDHVTVQLKLKHDHVFKHVNNYHVPIMSDNSFAGLLTPDRYSNEKGTYTLTIRTPGTEIYGEVTFTVLDELKPFPTSPLRADIIATDRESYKIGDKIKVLGSVKILPDNDVTIKLSFNDLLIDIIRSSVDDQTYTFSKDIMVDSAKFRDFGRYTLDLEYVELGGSFTIHTASTSFTVVEKQTSKSQEQPDKNPNVSSPNKKSNGGGCSGDCTPPTFGKNKQGTLIVHDGFSYNGNSVDVTKYHTPFPLITVNTGEINTVRVKVYENGGLDNIKLIQFGLGMPQAGSPLNEAQVIVEILLKKSNVDKVIEIDKNNLVDVISVANEIVDCNGSPQTQCLQITMNYIYRDQPKYNVMAINAVDIHRNSQTNFLNDGVLVIGESLNVPLETTVSVGKAGAFYPQRAGTVLLTLTDYKTDMWQDAYGYMWTGDNYKSFQLVDTIPVPIREPDKEWAAMTRMHSEFPLLILAEQDKATLIFDASNLIKTPTESWSYDIPDKLKAELELQERIASEADRAEKELQDWFDYIYAGKIQD